MLEWLRRRKKKAIVDRICPLVQLENQASSFLEPRATVGAMTISILPPDGNGSFGGLRDLIRRSNLEADRAFHRTIPSSTIISEPSYENTDEQLRMFLSQDLQ